MTVVEAENLKQVKEGAMVIRVYWHSTKETFACHSVGGILG